MKHKLRDVAASHAEAPEIDPKQYRDYIIRFGKRISSDDYEVELPAQAGHSSGEEEAEERKSPVKEAPPLFDKEQIKAQLQDIENLNLFLFRSENLKRGTVLWFVKRLSEDVAPFIASSLNEYRILFLYDYAEKQAIADDANENCKHFRKFLGQFTSLYLAELKAQLTKKRLHIVFISESLTTISEYARALSE